MMQIEKNRDASDNFSTRKRHRNVISFTATVLKMAISLQYLNFSGFHMLFDLLLIASHVYQNKKLKYLFVLWLELVLEFYIQ